MSTDVGITFVNAVMNTGTYNQIINLTLGAFQFSPSTDGVTIDPDLQITARLRMDIPCARHLHETLGKLLASIDSQQAALASNGTDASQADETTERPN